MRLGRWALATVLGAGLAASLLYRPPAAQAPQFSIPRARHRVTLEEHERMLAAACLTGVEEVRAYLPETQESRELTEYAFGSIDKEGETNGVMTDIGMLERIFKESRKVSIDHCHPSGTALPLEALSASEAKATFPDASPEKLAWASKMFLGLYQKEIRWEIRTPSDGDISTEILQRSYFYKFHPEPGASIDFRIISGTPEETHATRVIPSPALDDRLREITKYLASADSPSLKKALDEWSAGEALKIAAVESKRYHRFQQGFYRLGKPFAEPEDKLLELWNAYLAKNNSGTTLSYER